MGRALGGRLGHSRDDLTDRGRQRDAVESSRAQRVGDAQLLDRVQRQRFHADRAAITQFQRIGVHQVGRCDRRRRDRGTRRHLQIEFCGGWRWHGMITRQRRSTLLDATHAGRRARLQLLGIPLHGLLNLWRHRRRGYRRLRREHLTQPGAEQRPLLRRYIEMPAEIEQRHLLHPAIDALGAHQSVGEVGLAGQASTGLSAAHEHAPNPTACRLKME